MHRLTFWLKLQEHVVHIFYNNDLLELKKSFYAQVKGLVEFFDSPNNQ